MQNNVDCDTAFQLLTCWDTSSLSPTMRRGASTIARPERLANLKAHLQDCSHCRQLSQQLAPALALLDAVQAESPQPTTAPESHTCHPRMTRIMQAIQELPAPTSPAADPSTPIHNPPVEVFPTPAEMQSAQAAKSARRGMLTGWAPAWMAVAATLACVLVGPWMIGNDGSQLQATSNGNRLLSMSLPDRCLQITHVVAGVGVPARNSEYTTGHPRISMADQCDGCHAGDSVSATNVGFACCTTCHAADQATPSHVAGQPFQVLLAACQVCHLDG